VRLHLQGERPSSLDRYQFCESPWNTSCTHLYTLEEFRRRTMPVVLGRYFRIAGENEAAGAAVAAVVAVE
jgi:hypothetical protein